MLKIGLWCNGNTQDFGPCIMGSNPVSPTNIWLCQKSFRFFETIIFNILKWLCEADWMCYWVTAENVRRFLDEVKLRK